MRDGEPLARSTGSTHVAAGDALLKGLLESEIAAALIAVSAAPCCASLRSALDRPAVRELLQQHGCEPVICAAPRAMVLAARRQPAVAVVGARDLASMGCPPMGAWVLAAEDDAAVSPAISPVTFARAHDLHCLIAPDVAALREGAELALRMARLEQRPVVVSVHGSVFRSTEVISCRPNRVTNETDAAIRRRAGRRPKPPAGDVLRLVRRDEINRIASLPSPGERVPIGFVTCGPCTPALRQVVHSVGLSGRVPELALVCASPLDDVAVERLLGRCSTVIVLEPRPGEVGDAIAQIMRRMERSGGPEPADVHVRTLPPAEDGAGAVPIETDALIHVGTLAQAIDHLLRRIRPVRELPPTPPPRASCVTAPRSAGAGSAALVEALRPVVTEVDRWLQEHALDESLESGPPPTLAVDGLPAISAGRAVVPVELWCADEFVRTGVGAVQQAMRADARAWIFLVADAGPPAGIDPLRLARASVPAASAARTRVEEAPIDERERLAELMRESALQGGVLVLVVRDADPPRFDAQRIEQASAEVDRLGFVPQQRELIALDRIVAVRSPGLDEPDDDDVPPLRTDVRLDRLPRRLPRAAMIRVRPLLEQVEVTRSRPPAGRWRGDRAERPPIPEAAHARASIWRCHIAGWRRAAPGVAAEVLLRAGQRMGYVVRSLHDPGPIGPGVWAWTQLLFTQAPRGDQRVHAVASIAHGEADLVLGLDPAETVRALDEDPELRVAATNFTFAVVNEGGPSDDEGDVADAAIRTRLAELLAERTRGDGGFAGDVAAACRRWFHTDRVADIALLGIAFQLGLVPVTADAIEAAVQEIEREGHARASEAFRFGREIAIDAPRLLRARDAHRDEDDLGRLIRRLTHRSRQGRRGRDDRFVAIMSESVAAMPGLRETDRGRRALYDFVVALDRCRLWGGVDTVRRYATLVTDLYAHDRASAGRDLTRYAVLPLAGAMLIRDPIYIASVVTSSEHRRRLRRRLDVKTGRDDRIERRFLTRVEIVLGVRRLRADVRTSDWAPRFANLLRPLIPGPWRGSRREREVRDFVVNLVARCADAPAETYEHHQAALRRLYAVAEENRLRTLTLEEVTALVGEADTG